MGSPAGRKGLLRSRRPRVLQIVKSEREQVLNARADQRNTIYHARFKFETCNRFDSGIVENAVARLDNHDIHDFSFGSYIELNDDMALNALRDCPGGVDRSDTNQIHQRASGGAGYRIDVGSDDTV